MAAGGVDPNRDTNTITGPPPQLVANMKVGSMDTFCVCEPWNRQLINQKIGYTALTTSELWMNHPEKAFAMRPDYVPANPNATKALIAKVNREDLWRAAAKELGVAAKDIPTSTSRGVEKFFDGKVFDPANPKKYLDSLEIKNIKSA